MPDYDMPWQPPIGGLAIGGLTDSNGKPTPVQQAGTTDWRPAPATVTPDRVMILSEDEQRGMVEILDVGVVLHPRPLAIRAMRDRLAYGDEYYDEADELARLTLRKRRIEEEARRLGRRIAELHEPVVARLAEIGATSMRHEGTGALLMRDDTVRLAHRDPDWSTEEKAVAKDAAGEVLESMPETQDFVTPGWNHRRVEAWMRERYKTAVNEQLERPPEQREPVDAEAFVPEGLRPFYRLVVAPRIKVQS